MARIHVLLVSAVVLLAALVSVQSGDTHAWGQADSWEEDTETTPTNHQDEDDDSALSYVDTDEESERRVSSEEESVADTTDEDEGEEDEDEEDKEEVENSATPITEEELAVEAMKGTMDAAGIDKSVQERALAQLSEKGRANERSTGATSCQVFAMGKGVTNGPEKCTEGNVAQCLTSKIDLEIDGEVKTMYTSNCDKMKLCQGMGKGYYTIENGKCGTMPGKGGQTIYCSQATPKDGKIPEGVECPKIQMKVINPETGKEFAPTPSPSTGKEAVSPTPVIHKGVESAAPREVLSSAIVGLSMAFMATLLAH